MMNIGEKLKKLRVRMKKTLKEASTALNVSLNTVYRWEHGLSTPRKTVLKKAAGYYCVPLEYLLDENLGEGEDRRFDFSIDYEFGVDRKILEMIENLPEHSKYRVLGYIECISAETEIL